MSGRYWDAQLETLPRERRRQLREHRLHWQLRRCWDGSPFYRARLEAAGLDPSAFGGLADLARIPILRPADLPRGAAAGEASVAWTVAPADWWAERDDAGGGVVRVLTDGDLLHRADVAARALWSAGGRPGLTLSIAHAGAEPAVLAAVAGGAERVGMVVASGPSRPPESDELFRVEVSLAARPGDAVGPQEPSPPAAPPHAGAGSCSEASLPRRRRAMRTTARSGPAPSMVWTDIWPPDWRPARAGAGALAVAGVAPTVAYACGEAEGLHWADDHFLVEILQPATGQPAPAETPGQVVLTDLTREGSPLLRFPTELEALLLDRPCPCGRTSARSPFVRPLA